MAATKPHDRSFAADRELAEMAKCMTLDDIVRQTGRKRQTIIKTALRLGISTKGWKSKAKAR